MDQISGATKYIVQQACLFNQLEVISALKGLFKLAGVYQTTSHIYSFDISSEGQQFVEVTMSQMISYQTAVPYLTKDTRFLYLNLATLSFFYD